MITSRTDPARSATMRSVRSEDTRPELLIRSILHRLGYRYRLHDKSLPGKPDIVFAGRRKIVFVHGCFWHGHDCARGRRVPKANREYWVRKITQNRERDKEHAAALNAQGWQALIIWECEIGIPENLESRLIRFLDQPGSA
ncbi:MAG: very short patch repair endonuclease [Acidobacteriota bacterium]|nr:very short patch repair endonuclease [Acidobacteriota bacterium]